MADSAPAEPLRPLAPIVARWRTSGTVLDEQGATVMTVSGTDEYEWMPGGHWVIHRVDVMMGDDHTRAIELIGDPGDGDTFVMRAFDASGAYDEMSLTVRDRRFDTTGDGVRNTLVVAPDGASMAATWERRLDDGRWVRWMDLTLKRYDDTP
jgi:hypothetical protein